MTLALDAFIECLRPRCRKCRFTIFDAIVGFRQMIPQNINTHGFFSYDSSNTLTKSQFVLKTSHNALQSPHRFFLPFRTCSLHPCARKSNVYEILSFDSDDSFELRAVDGARFMARCVNPVCTPGRACPEYRCATITPFPMHISVPLSKPIKMSPPGEVVPMEAA